MNVKLGCKGTAFVLKSEKKTLLLFKILVLFLLQLRFHNVLFDNELRQLLEKNVNKNSTLLI